MGKSCKILKKIEEKGEENVKIIFGEIEEVWDKIERRYEKNLKELHKDGI